MTLPRLRKLGFRLIVVRPARPARPAGAQLMLPVTPRPRAHQLRPADQLVVGSLVSDEAPRAIDARLPHLHAAAGHVHAWRWPPSCSRRSAALAARHDLDGLRATMANGVRQIFLLLIPARRLYARALRADHAPDLPARRRSAPASTEQVAEALFWFSFSPAVHGRQPAAHAHVLLPPAALAPDVDGASSTWSSTPSSLALYKPFGDRRPRDRHGDRQPRDDAAGQMYCPAPRAQRARGGAHAPRRWRR